MSEILTNLGAEMPKKGAQSNKSLAAQHENYYAFEAALNVARSEGVNEAFLKAMRKLAVFYKDKKSLAHVAANWEAMHHLLLLSRAASTIDNKETPEFESSLSAFVKLPQSVALVSAGLVVNGLYAAGTLTTLVGMFGGICVALTSSSSPLLINHFLTAFVIGVGILLVTVLVEGLINLFYGKEFQLRNDVSSAGKKMLGPEKRKAAGKAPFFRKGSTTQDATSGGCGAAPYDFARKSTDPDNSVIVPRVGSA